MITFGAGQIAVADGQLSVTAVGVAPTGATRRMDSLSPFYPVVLSASSGVVSWSANVSNRDDVFNNGFDIVLACNNPNPFDISSVGYALRGGSMVGNRMVLYSFDFGLAGGGREFIEISSENGLGVLPQKGSFRVTYDPATQEWTVFGERGESYVNARSVSTQLGKGIDDVHTRKPLPYFGLGALSAGTSYFDNIAVAVIPEPTSLQLIILGGALFLSTNLLTRLQILRRIWTLISIADPCKKT